MTTESDRYGNRTPRFADLPHEVNWQAFLALRFEAKQRATATSRVIPIESRATFSPVEPKPRLGTQQEREEAA
jgi:hypothetical protein